MTSQDEELTQYSWASHKFGLLDILLSNLLLSSWDSLLSQPELCSCCKDKPQRKLSCPASCCTRYALPYKAIHLIKLLDWRCSFLDIFVPNLVFFRSFCPHYLEKICQRTVEIFPGMSFSKPATIPNHLFVKIIYCVYICFHHHLCSNFYLSIFLTLCQ